MKGMGEHTTVFARNGWIVRGMPAAAVASLLIGIAFLLHGDRGTAAIWLLMSLLWFFNYRWSRRNPFAVVSGEGLKLRSSPLLPDKEIAWHAVMNAQLSGPSRLTLYLVSGNRYSIYLTWIASGDRKRLIRMVETSVAEKGAIGGGGFDRSHLTGGNGG